VLERDDVLAVGQHHPADRHLVHLADGLADHREGIVADLAVGPQVIGADKVARINLLAIDELVDLDGAGRFKRDVLEFFLRHFDEGVGIDLVALDDVFVGDFLAGVGVDLGVLDAVAGLPVERATAWIAADRPCAESQAGRLSRSAFGSLGRLGKVTANDYRPSSERMSNGNPQGGENVERS
jgi:hypothetical protein